MIDVPGYRIERTIGQGGMASVYLAIQVSLQRKVALKVMAPELVEDVDFCRRFLKEGVTTGQLNHPNIVTIYDCGHVGKHYYMAMEYITGGTLAEKIGSGLKPADALQILIDVARALRYAHQRNTIHRDVKPGNILFRDDGSAVLSDFGIAKALDSGTEMTRVGFAVGTPKYMSPEQAMAQPLDGRSDLYSLGVVFYQMLVGHLPTLTRSKSAVPGDTPGRKLVTPQVPQHLRQFQPIINELLAVNPDDRYPDAGSLIHAAEKVLRLYQQPSTSRTTASYTAESEMTVATGVERVNRLFGKWGVGVGIFGAMAVGVVAWLVENKSIWDKFDFIKPSAQVISETGETSAMDDSLKVEQKSRERAQHLLMIAEAHVMVGRFMAPVGSNAYEAYLKVLEIDPGNSRARIGLREIINEYMNRSPASWDRAELDQMRQQIDEGLKIDPGNDDLRALRGKIAGLYKLTR